MKLMMVMLYNNNTSEQIWGRGKLRIYVYLFVQELQILVDIDPV